MIDMGLIVTISPRAKYAAKYTLDATIPQTHINLFKAATDQALLVKLVYQSDNEWLVVDWFETSISKLFILQPRITDGI